MFLIYAKINTTANYEIDWDLIWNVIAAIGSIATAVTIIFIFQQRKDSVKPTVLIQYYNEFKIKFGENNDPYWAQNDKDFVLPFFNLINPGNGLAENIKVVPYFKKEKFISYLKKIDKNNDFNFESHESNYFITNSKKSIIANFRVGLVEKFQASTLIDMKTDSNYKLKVPLTYSYVEIIRAFEFIISEYKTSGYYVVIDFPKMFYKICYDDSLGNEYFSYYEISLFRGLEIDLIFRKISKKRFEREIQE